MAIILIILLLPVVIYGLRAMVGSQTAISHGTKVIRAVFISFILFYIILMVVEKYNYYLRGYRSTSFVFLALTLAGILYCLSDRRPIFTSFVRGLLNLVVILGIWGSGFLVPELIYDYKRQLYYSDNKLRLEEKTRGLMAPCGLPVLFIKEGLLERTTTASDYEEDPCIFKRDVYKITIEEKVSFYAVTYYLTQDRDSNQFLGHTAHYKKP